MANRGSILSTNEYLRTNDCLVSPNGQFFAVMQSDGNLCVYEGAPDNIGNFRWGWTDWSRNQDDYFTIMQSDGNLCVYHGSGPNDNRSHMWSARTDPPGEGVYITIMQDDGNLCVYGGTTPSVETYVWSWMDAYSHLFRESSSFFDTIGNGLRSAGTAFENLGRGMEDAGKAAWQATSETAAGVAEGAERAGTSVSDSFIAGAEATRSALETGAEVTRQGLVQMGHYVNQHACSIGVGSALTATVTTMLSSSVGAPLIAVLATSAARSGNDAALSGSVQALAYVLAEPVSMIPIPGFSQSRDQIGSVIAFLLLKAIKAKPPGGEVEPGFWGGLVIYGLTEFICSGKLPGGYSVWAGAQSHIPSA